ncbi:MAG TPA: hypothetical protein VIY53_00395 [Acidobacteriaceae bacterium]
MIALALPIVLPVGTILLYFWMAWLLLRQIARTGERAYAWLVVALVIWPSIVWALNGAGSIVLRNPRQAAHVFPYSMSGALGVSTGLMYEIIGAAHQLIGNALLVVAVYSLCRTNLQRVTRQAA